MGPGRGGKGTRKPRWNQRDVEIFLRCLCEHGKNFKKINELLPTKTRTQLSSYFYNHIWKLKDWGRGFDFKTIDWTHIQALLRERRAHKESRQRLLQPKLGDDTGSGNPGRAVKGSSTRESSSSTEQQRNEAATRRSISGERASPNAGESTNIAKGNGAKAASGEGTGILVVTGEEYTIDEELHRVY
jgi:hypothetical protein